MSSPRLRLGISGGYSITTLGAFALGALAIYPYPYRYFGAKLRSQGEFTHLPSRFGNHFYLSHFICRSYHPPIDSPSTVLVFLCPCIFVSDRHCAPVNVRFPSLPEGLPLETSINRTNEQLCILRTVENLQRASSITRCWRLGQWQATQN